MINTSQKTGRRSLSNSLSSIELTKESIRLNNSAQPKLAMLIPCTNLLARSTTNAFITNRKRPRVRIVTGRVSKMIRGFIKILRIASTAANTIAVQKVSICTPLSTCERPNETAAIIIMRIRNLMGLFLINNQ
jgi:hypothetical protein